METLREDEAFPCSDVITYLAFSKAGASCASFQTIWLPTETQAKLLEPGETALNFMLAKLEYMKHPNFLILIV